MSQIISMLMSFLMVFIQFITSFIGGGGTNPVNPDNPVTPDTPDTSTSMCWPLNKESYVSAGYPNYDDGTYHGGIDIVLKSGNSEGEPFIAVQDGKVTLALNDGQDNLGYGNCILIDHGNGISSFYAHAKSIAVAENATVKKGQTIGYIGKTGNATGAHLHLEIWKNNARVNPLDYVKNPYGDTTPTTPETPETPIDPADIKGTFTFKVYGWGHGVGMSQDGAITMAKNGKTYNEILFHYYPGTNLRVDGTTPAKVTKNGTEVSIVEYLCKTVAKEIGPSAPMEALKAQAVACYTYAKLYGYESGQSYNASFAYSGTDVEKAVWAVCSMTKATDTPKARYLEYNNKVAETYYFANAAGKTTSCSATWGGTQPDYLKGGVSSPEKVDESTKTYTAKEMYDLIQAYAKSVGKTVTLGKDPSKWIQIVSHDKSMSDSVGYVVKIKVGGIEMSGNTFRSKVLNYGLRSHCFTVAYSSK